MAGRLQKRAAIAIAAMAWGAAHAGEGLAERTQGLADRYASAGTTLQTAPDWHASLFVSHFGPRGAEDPAAERRSLSFVNARLTHELGKDTFFSIDVLNVLDKRPTDADSFSAPRFGAAPGVHDGLLPQPSESRGVVLRFRTTF